MADDRDHLLDHLPDEVFEKCLDFIAHAFRGNPDALEEFQLAMDQGRKERILEFLKDGLLETGPRGEPFGKRGTLTERIAAETVIKQLETGRAQGK